MRLNLTLLPVLALACANLPQPAKGANERTLAARSEWTLEALDDRCRMARSFGADGEAVTVWLEKAGPGPFLNITMIGAPFDAPKGPQITLAFAPGKAIARSFVFKTTSTGLPSLSVFGVRPESADEPEAKQLAHLEEVQAIVLSGLVGGKINLEIGPMAGMMEQLRECTDALPERQAQLPRAERAAPADPAPGAPMRVATDYPRHLRREGAQGVVSVRVQISPQGRATFCEIVGFQGHPDFSNQSCQFMLGGARFEPATDSSGYPVWATFTTKLTYKLD